MLNRFSVLVLALLGVATLIRCGHPSNDGAMEHRLEPKLSQTYSTASPEDLYIATTRFRWRCNPSALEECELVEYHRSPVGVENETYRTFFTRERQFQFASLGLRLADEDLRRQIEVESGLNLPDYDQQYADRLLQVNKQLQVRLRQAGLFEPEQGVLPTWNEAWHILVPLLEWKLHPGDRSVLERLLDEVDAPEVPILERVPVDVEDPSRSFVAGTPHGERRAHIPFEYCTGNVVLRGNDEDIAIHRRLYSEIKEPEYVALVDETVRRFEAEYEPQEGSGNVFRQEFLTVRFQRLADERGIDEWIRRAKSE